MRKLYVLALLLISLQTSWAGQERGGGDPAAAEFGQLMVNAADFLLLNSKLIPELDTKRAKDVSATLFDSLNEPGRALFEVTENRPLDPYGLEKGAVFSVEPLGIVLHRRTWNELASEGKVALVLMELMGLCGIDQRRYEQAFQIAKEYAPYIVQPNRKNPEVLSYLLIDVPTNETMEDLIMELTPEGRVSVFGYKLNELDHYSLTFRMDKLVPNLIRQEKQFFMQTEQGLVHCATVRSMDRRVRVFLTGECRIKSEFVVEGGIRRFRTYFVVRLPNHP